MQGITNFLNTIFPRNGKKGATLSRLWIPANTTWYASINGIISPTIDCCQCKFIALIIIY